MVAGAVEASGAGVGALHVEITESMLVDDEPCTGNLASLRALGVAVSIDDFGTGYSSLSFLKRHPVDTIKVDRSFVAGLGKPGNDTSIVAAIGGLGKTLGLHVLAEGIETSAQ